MPITHLAIPFTILGDGTVAAITQDTTDDIAQCVEVLCATPLGSRIEVPGYGIPDQTFTRYPNTQAITTSINTWEPRARVSVTATPGEQAAVSVTVAPVS